MHPIRLRPRVVLLTALLALGLCPPGLAALDAGIAPPLAVDDAATVKTLTTIDIPVLDNDSDPDGDFLEITTPTEPTPTAHGSVLCGFDVCSYTSEADYTGPDGFDYTVSDGNGGTDVGHVAITVAANTEPVAVDDETDVRTGSTQTIFVLDNDFDADGDLIVVTTLAPSAAHGTVSCEDFGQCVYTSTPGYVGEDGFDYAISDGNGGTDTGHVSIQVFANTPPDALDDQAARSDSTVVDVLANDFDPDGDLLELVSVTQPAFGSATIDPDTSTIVYSQTSNLGASDSFTYTISDGSAQSTATVTLEPCPSLASALDAGGLVVGERWVMCSSPTANSAAGPTTTVLPPFNGTSALLTSGDVSEAPGPNDETGAGTSNGTQGRGAFDPSILRLDLNVPAGANCLSFDLAFQSEEFPEFVGSYNDGVLAELDASTWELDGNTINAPLNFAFDAGGGIVSVNSAFFSPDRVITDTGSQYDGSTPLLSVRTPITPGSHALYLSIFDAGDGILDSAAFIDRLAAGPAGPGGCAAGANEPPVAVDDEFEVVEDLEVSLDVRANDSDPDGHEITITSSAPTAAHGTVSCSAFVCTYTPDADYFGPDSFTYSISDGHGGTDTATVSVTVTPVNDDPVATADVISTTEGSPGSANVLANDSDVDGDTVTILSFTQGLHGSVSCAGTDCTYTPNPGYSGPDSFTYTVSDGHGGTDVATVAVTVEPADNEPPVADDETMTTPEDVSDSVNVLIGDTDPDGDPLTVTSLAPTAEHGTVACGPGGTCQYTPAANYHGSDGFDYTVSDGHGGTDTGHVSITVTPVNDDPVAVDDELELAEDGSDTVNVLANDTDVDSDTLTVTTPSPTAAHGTVSCTAAGVCTYTPNANYNGLDSFTYTVSDGNDGSDSATVTITVTAVNDDPNAGDDSLSTGQDTAKDVNVLGNDTDVDGDSLTVTTLAPTATHGTVACTAAGVCTYTPEAGYTGSDSFDYGISDGHGGTDTATVSVMVTPNQDPSAVDDELTTAEDTAKGVDVLANDTDPEDDDLTVTSLAPSAAHGSVSCTGAGLCTYTPDANYHGSDGFDYAVSDGHGGTDTGHVSITVTPVNDDPVAVDDSATTGEDAAKVVSVLGNDSDVDGDSVTVTSASPTAAHGTVACTSGGECTYTPDANYNGPDSFVYTVSDGNGGSDTGHVAITVTPVNDDPNAGDDSLSTGQDTAKDVNVLGNDTDVDGDSLTVTTLAPTATHGTVACTAAGVCTYTPEAGYTGSDSFDYAISDGHGGTDTATVSVTVTPADTNTPPSCTNVKPSKTKLWPPRHKFKLIVLSGATDADGDPLTWTITKVTQDEKVKNAITKKDKGPDAKRVPGKPNQVELRAERIGDRNGRVYRIFFTVSDGNGGTCSGKVKVGVPKHKNGNAVDNVGKSYNSFG